MRACAFCEIIAGRAPAELVAVWADAIAIVPLRPVVAGHTLVLPKRHVRHAGHQPHVTASTMGHAAELAAAIMPDAFNIITSAGRDATQTVDHLHLHLVPRRPGDGLALPWAAP